MGCINPIIRYNNGQITSLKKVLYSDRKARENGLIIDGVTIHSEETNVLEALRNGSAQLLPCGHCTACKLQQSKNWANRMEMELPYHNNAWFLTLTYDDEHVPYRYTIDESTGEIITENLSLCYKDMELFWKRVRAYMKYHKRDNGKLMYFQAGEYGGKTHRPHYHTIVYDLNIKKDELKIYKQEKGYTYYNCEWISKLWGMGHVVITAAEWQNMAYTARYTAKKVYGKEGKKFYEELGIEPEKCIMSKGIGKKYYEEHKDKIYETDKIQLLNGKTIKPPRYFDKLFDKEHGGTKFEESEKLTKAESDELKEIKRKRRKIANDQLWTNLKKSNITMEEYYKAKERSINDKMKKLIRDEI